MFCALRARPRARRELYRVSQADLGEFRLGPRPSRLGLLAFRARKRAGGTAGRQAVRPLGAPHRLFAWTAPAWRRVPGCCPCTIPLAVPAQPRALRGYRHRIHRQRSEFDPAGPLVWPAIADRDGDCVFRDRRRRVDSAAGIAGPDRSGRLARGLSDFWRRRAVPAVAAAGIAVAIVLHRLAASLPPPRPRLPRWRL